MLEAKARDELEPRRKHTLRGGCNLLYDVESARSPRRLNASTNSYRKSCGKRVKSCIIFGKRSTRQISLSPNAYTMPKLFKAHKAFTTENVVRHEELLQ